MRMFEHRCWDLDEVRGKWVYTPERCFRCWLDGAKIVFQGFSIMIFLAALLFSCALIVLP